MNVEVYGNSPASAFLAALLSSSRIPVSWYTTGTEESVRPVLLHSGILGRIRRLLVRHGISAEFLLNAPELELWGIPGKAFARFRFDFNKQDADRWVSSTDLTNAFAELARKQGANLRYVPVLPPIQGGAELGLLRFVDVNPEDAPHWPRASADGANRNENPRWQVTEIALPRVGIEAPQMSQFMLLEGSLASLEPHPEAGYVLTLIAHSRYSIERALATLSGPRSSGPRLWRALCLMNPAPHRRDYSRTSGPSNLKFTDVFPLGASVGTYSPCLNLHVSESLKQVERLFEYVLASDALPERWIESERRHFLTLQKRMTLWEKCLASERFHDEFLTVAAFLPRAVRHYLRTPL